MPLKDDYTNLLTILKLQDYYINILTNRLLKSRDYKTLKNMKT